MHTHLHKHFNINVNNDKQHVHAYDDESFLSQKQEQILHTDNHAVLIFDTLYDSY